MTRPLALALAVVLVFSAVPGRASPVPAHLVEAGGLSLTLLHVNDMHARYEQTNALSGTCSDQDAKAGRCYGGQARVATVAKKARAEDENVLFLNAGDMYQGTVYYSVFKSSISAEFINLMQYDAVTLGNHEFDDKSVGLVPFIKALKVPLVVANLDFSKQPDLAALSIAKSVVVEKSGVKIGIIGYLTPETAFLSSPENVTFSDEVEAIKAEAEALKAQGVHIIIGLGHSGYERDQVIARDVPDIDIVVGGHSHSFLFTGKNPPDSDKPVGLYPTWVEQTGGRRVPVVQAYAFTKYMGKLKLEFNAAGELTDLDGGPILLNKDIEEDPDTLAEVQKWKSQLDEKVLQPIGRTSVLLDGSSCRRQECNLGNLVADAFVYSRAKNVRSAAGWTDAPIALVNGGSIRESIDASSVNGVITLKDVMEVMPFDNLEVLLRLRGAVLWEALEHSVSEYIPGNAWKGAFLQLSGVRVTYDVSRSPGQRVMRAEVRCANCTIPTYSPLDRTALYGVVVSGFLAGGGDGFTMLANNEGAERLENTDAVAVEDYIEKRGLVYPGVENRIVFADSGTSTSTSTSTTTPTSKPTSPSSSTSTTPAASSSGRALPTALLLAGALLLLL